jgi:hypothetical protein
MSDAALTPFWLADRRRKLAYAGLFVKAVPPHRPTFTYLKQTPFLSTCYLAPSG